MDTTYSAARDRRICWQRIWWALGLALVFLVASACARTPTPTPTPVPPTPTPTPTPRPAATPSPTPPPLPGPTATSPAQEGLRLTLSLSKGEFRVGENIEARLTLASASPQEIAVTTNTSQLFDLLIRSKGGEQRWSSGRAFLPVVTTHHIPPIGGLSQTLTWQATETGDLTIVGLTVQITIDSKQVQLQTPPVTVAVR
ncbi:hypothetical protein HRbin23_00780 [bacterium HR23]|nr:hypothetical protein HRbin23_00780 [bacterium HR23]